MAFKIAIVGATGNVGREMIKILSERCLQIREITALASKKSVGKKIPFRNQSLEVIDLDSYDFSGTDICLMSAGSEISKNISPKIAETGCIVIDNSSAWRYDDEVPLIVPEVNPEAISLAYQKNIIANPNCSTIQLVVALKPLHDYANIKRVVLSTYQSVSGAGKKGMDELIEQTKSFLKSQTNTPEIFTKNIAFNIIPHIDVFMNDSYTKEEWKVAVETNKILDPNIKINCTAARVPVLIGHSESVNIEFNNCITAEKARSILSKSSGCIVIDEPKDGGYMTPSECNEKDHVFVSRIREDDTIKNGINLWIVSNNLRKGAALNAVQIAEILVENKI
ncbi:aspartate-semialdehyde dehydrogenase [Candidatus Liberibacter americanus]|uniref:Aspartate-semialdehyde dehydrogenase n=1 Tax=Candidatus Liberibacter americanus str. Sao Paulo TaxID=1261131 RepID=U6B3W8_9HYPH|nr:aspartate-semialdehyde dehydrogenase [Candidatus Liberibacter americanus]AHA27744.1 Aspartate-semialdehyde dehydrogenase [Candidatus Liberibacter americanus str. Sao Paulo]EMS36129.1 aspartate-semialdehyde dehydrogenase [Candidatus Liberibacter americanus PW_SP]